jgi:hypothetical protein
MLNIKSLSHGGLEINLCTLLTSSLDLGQLFYIRVKNSLRPLEKQVECVGTCNMGVSDISLFNNCPVWPKDGHRNM